MNRKRMKNQLGVTPMRIPKIRTTWIDPPPKPTVTWSQAAPTRPPLEGRVRRPEPDELDPRGGARGRGSDRRRRVALHDRRGVDARRQGAEREPGVARQP